MKSKGFEGMACSMAEVMAALGDRWGALVMRDLLLGLTRYHDLQRSTGITNATLSGRLRDLERVGLIERRRYQANPERNEYIPTNKGGDLALVMLAMVQVGDKWRGQEKRSEPLRFVSRTSRDSVRLALIDHETNADGSTPVQIEAGPGADELMKWRIERGEAERERRAEMLAT